MTRWLSLLAILAALGASGYVFAGRGALPPGAAADSVVIGDSARALCGGRSGAARSDCYEQVLTAAAIAHGPRVAMGALNRIGARDGAVRSAGHVYAHAIGIAAGSQPGAVGAIFASCTETFQSGCYHGVIQAYFQSAQAVDGPAVNALCSSYTAPTADQWLRFQCVHGMGHGLTMFYGHDVRRALAGCDLLYGSWDRNSCYGGVFMENIVNATQPHHPASRIAQGGEHHHGHAGHDTAAAPPFKALDPADPQYPCSVMEGRYLEQCWMMQASVMLWQTGQDIAATARLCAAAPGRFAYICHESLGREIGPRAREQAGRAARLCAQALGEYQPWCHAGVAKVIMAQRARPEEGLAYCRAVPGTRNKLVCYAATGEQIASLVQGMPNRRLLCDQAEAGYQAACQYGAGVLTEPPLGMPRPRA